MIAGFNMLSFDLFGLGGKALGSKFDKQQEIEFVSETIEDKKTEIDDEDLAEQHISFWSLYPLF